MEDKAKKYVLERKIPLLFEVRQPAGSTELANMHALFFLVLFLLCTLNFDWPQSPTEFDDRLDGPPPHGPYWLHHRLPQAAAPDGRPQLGHVH